MTLVQEATKTVFRVPHRTSTSEGIAEFGTEAEATQFACFCDLDEFFPYETIEIIKSNPDHWEQLFTIFNRLVGTL